MKLRVKSKALNFGVARTGWALTGWAGTGADGRGRARRCKVNLRRMIDAKIESRAAQGSDWAIYERASHSPPKVAGCSHCELSFVLNASRSNALGQSAPTDSWRQGREITMPKTALDGSRLNAFAMNPDDLVIVTDTNHHLYDERIHLPLDENLVRNIMVYGVKLTCLVAKEGDKVLVVEGRQRVRAAIEANKRLVKEGKEPIRVPCFVTRGDESELFGISISCNENRIDDTPMAKAVKAQRLLNMGRSEDDVAVVFGVTKTAVGQWLKLLELSAPVRKAVEAGTVTASAAAKLHSLPPDKQKEKLEAIIASGSKPTAKNIERAAKGKSAASKAPSKAEINAMRDRAPEEDRALLAWVLGEMSIDEAAIEKGWMKNDDEENENEKR